MFIKAPKASIEAELRSWCVSVSAFPLKDTLYAPIEDHPSAALREPSALEGEILEIPFAIQKEAMLFCGSSLRKGEVFAYVQTLKDLHAKVPKGPQGEVLKVLKRPVGPLEDLSTAFKPFVKPLVPVLGLGLEAHDLSRFSRTMSYGGLLPVTKSLMP